MIDLNLVDRLIAATRIHSTASTTEVRGLCGEAADKIEEQAREIVEMNDKVYKLAKTINNFLVDSEK